MLTTEQTMRALERLGVPYGASVGSDGVGTVEVEPPNKMPETASLEAAYAEWSVSRSVPTPDDLVRAFVDASDTDTVADIKARMESKVDERTAPDDDGKTSR